MPRKVLKAVLVCPEQGCTNELTSAGLYHRTRSILGLESYYNLAAEYLECSRCKKKYISWDERIIKQLDLAHQLHFPAVLTYQYGCDKQVVRMMRLRSLGNSATQLQKRLVENHCDKWMQKSLLYLTDWEAYSRSNLVVVRSAESPPIQTNLPSVKWLLSVHLKDVINRLPALKASITSTYGTVLKIDSTKKVTTCVYAIML